MVLMARYKKRLSPQVPLPSMPPQKTILHRLAAFDPTARTLHLKAVPVPRCGVLSAYRVLTEDEALAY